MAYVVSTSNVTRQFIVIFGKNHIKGTEGNSSQELKETVLKISKSGTERNGSQDFKQRKETVLMISKNGTEETVLKISKNEKKRFLRQQLYRRYFHLQSVLALNACVHCMSDNISEAIYLETSDT